MTQDIVSPVTSEVVADDQRMTVLPSLFGRYLLGCEAAIYARTEKSCAEYKGGFWTFAALSNGGYFMYPDMGEGSSFSYEVPENGWTGQLTAEAMGIVACLFVLSSLSCQLYERGLDNKMATENYHKLRDYALDHAEASAIFAAID